MAALQYFTVTYDALGVTADRNTDPDADPEIRPMTCNVEFVYRTPPGFAFRAANYGSRPTDLGFGGFICRVDEARLKGLDGTVNFRLPANTDLLQWEAEGYGADLFIDIVFTNVVYARDDRVWKNFAIICPTMPDTTVNLTTVQRYPYVPRNKYGDYFSNRRAS